MDGSGRMSVPKSNNSNESVDDNESVSPVLGLFVVGTFVLFILFVFFFFFIRPLVFG